MNVEIDRTICVVISADWANGEAGPYSLILWRYVPNVAGNTYLPIILIHQALLHQCAGCEVDAESPVPFPGR
jgi:hypothetical protein